MVSINQSRPFNSLKTEKLYNLEKTVKLWPKKFPLKQSLELNYTKYPRVEVHSTATDTKIHFLVHGSKSEAREVLNMH